MLKKEADKPRMLAEQILMDGVFLPARLQEPLRHKRNE